MKFSKINLFSCLALSCSLIACGQAQATVPNATSSPIAQTSTATNSPSPAKPIVADSRTDSRTVAKVKNGAKCSRVISTVKDVLETIPNVKVTNNSRFSGLPTPYPDRSANLNREYIFAISGSGVTDFWKSGKAVQTEIAKEIIENCRGVAAVTFARDRTGESGTIGLFPDGSIKGFTCGPDFDRHTRTRPPLTWGQQACDL